MVNNPTCQHKLISIATNDCLDCHEKMIGLETIPEYLKDAPNAMACNNKACQDALDNGTYDNDAPPAGCTNPTGVYIPDYNNEREVLVGMKYKYTCIRCSQNATSATWSGSGTITWPCGGHHVGKS